MQGAHKAWREKVGVTSRANEPSGGQVSLSLTWWGPRTGLTTPAMSQGCTGAQQDGNGWAAPILMQEAWSILRWTKKLTEWPWDQKRKRQAGGFQGRRFEVCLIGWECIRELFTIGRGDEPQGLRGTGGRDHTRWLSNYWGRPRKGWSQSGVRYLKSTGRKKSCLFGGVKLGCWGSQGWTELHSIWKQLSSSHPIICFV